MEVERLEVRAHVKSAQLFQSQQILARDRQLDAEGIRNSEHNRHREVRNGYEHAPEASLPGHSFIELPHRDRLWRRQREGPRPAAIDQLFKGVTEFVDGDRVDGLPASSDERHDPMTLNGVEDGARKAAVAKRQPRPDDEIARGIEYPFELAFVASVVRFRAIARRERREEHEFR